MTREKFKLIMPNHIIIKDGLACGDRITLLYDFEEELMLFQLISEGCSYCERVCDFLQKTFNGKVSVTIKTECTDLIEQLRKTENALEKIVKLPFRSTRMECCIAPIRILIECASESLFSEKSENCELNLKVDRWTVTHVLHVKIFHGFMTNLPIYMDDTA